MTDRDYTISNNDHKVLATANTPADAYLAAKTLLEEGQCAVAVIRDWHDDWILDLYFPERGAGPRASFWDTAKTRKFRAAAKK